MPVKVDPVRLVAQLQNTGLANKDNPLYQLLFQLIGQLQTIANNVNGGSGGGGGGGSTIINQITNILGNPAYNRIEKHERIIMIGSNSSSTPVSVDYYWAPLTDGDVDETDLIFAAGECIMVQVPNP